MDVVRQVLSLASTLQSHQVEDKSALQTLSSTTVAPMRFVQISNASQWSIHSAWPLETFLSPTAWSNFVVFPTLCLFLVQKKQLKACLHPQFWNSFSSFGCLERPFVVCCSLSRSCSVELAASHLRCPSHVRTWMRLSWPLAADLPWFGSRPEARTRLRTCSRTVLHPSRRSLSVPWLLRTCCTRAHASDCRDTPCEGLGLLLGFWTMCRRGTRSDPLPPSRSVRSSAGLGYPEVQATIVATPSSWFQRRCLTDKMTSISCTT